MKELEIIIQLIAQLGDVGKEAFIWWLIMDKGLPFILFMFLFWGVGHILDKLIKSERL